MAKKYKINEDEDPAYKPYKRNNEKKRKNKQHKKLNSFTWSSAEQTLYVQFLENHKDLFVSIEQRKKSKVFVQMTLFIKKRGSDQCRSHHQKMSIKYGSIDQIIKNITQQNMLNVKIPQSEQCSIYYQSQPDEHCSGNKLQIQDKSQSKLPQASTQLASVNPQEQRQLWAYMDTSAWISH